MTLVKGAVKKAVSLSLDTPPFSMKLKRMGHPVFVDGPEGMRPGTVLTRQQQIPHSAPLRAGSSGMTTEKQMQSTALAEAEDWVRDVGLFERGDLFWRELNRECGYCVGEVIRFGRADDW
jgi:hypothetical protein